MKMANQKDTMKSFKKYLNEDNEQEDYEKNHREWLDSIHSMPLEDAEAQGEMDLVSNPKLFIDSPLSIHYHARIIDEVEINPDHAFTRFLSHPQHTDESVLEHINYLLKFAHAKDISGGYRARQNTHQAATFLFTATRFQNIELSMFREANDKIEKRDRPPILAPMREKDPIFITPEHIEHVKRHYHNLKYDPRTKSIGHADPYYGIKPGIFYPNSLVIKMHDY